MKCEICGKEILRDSQCINYKYYHNDCIENLKQENQQLKERIAYLERSNNRREDTILEQRQEISDLEDNWNKLKEIAKSQSGFKKRADLKGGLWFEVDDLLDKMQEMEKNYGNMEDNT